MKTTNLGKLRPLLDSLSAGLLPILESACERQDVELHLYVLTHQEGLPRDQMQLCLQGLDAEGTRFRHTIDIPPDQHDLGWNLYLEDCLGSCREHLSSAQEQLDKIEADEPQSD